MQEKIKEKISQRYSEAKDKIQQKLPQLYYHLYNNKLIIKFYIIAALTGLVDFSFLVVFYDIFGINIVLSSAIAFVAAFFFNFKLNKNWAFRHHTSSDNQELFSYLFLNLIKLFLNSLLMYALVSQYGVWYVYAQLIVGFILNLGAFFMTKLFVFKS